MLSTVFERLASPVIRTIAKDCGYEVEISNQTTYPDFTLSNVSTGDRIAVDIKTTYESNRMVLTLGGYNSFLRTDTKNILYPYSTYRRHWIVGFVYRQLLAYPPYTVHNMPARGDIKCPYKVMSVFVREKHEISGLRAGSGNTKNIGSVPVGNPIDFSTVMGPFTFFRKGKLACDHYWRDYERYGVEISTTQQLLVHADFQQFGPTA